MKIELKLLRVKNGLTQKDFAKTFGISLSNYYLIESGARDGSIDFWQKVKEHFNLNDDEAWKVMTTTMTK